MTPDAYQKWIRELRQEQARGVPEYKPSVAEREAAAARLAAQART